MAEEQVDVGDQINELLAGEGLWAVVIDGETVPILRLSPGVLGAIQRKYDASWVMLTRFPTTYLDAAEALVSAAAAKIGSTDPAPIAETDDLLSRFVRIPSDLPEVELSDAEQEPNPTDGSSTAS